jgi:hypothetical protein
MKKLFLLLLTLSFPFLATAQENTHIVIVKQKIIKYGKPNEVSKEYKIYKMTDEAWATFKEDGLKKELAAYGDNLIEAKSNTFTSLSATIMTPPPPKEAAFDSHYYMDHVASSGNCYVIYKNKAHTKKGEELICKVTKPENLEKLLSQIESKNKHFDSLVKQECID